MSEANSRTKRKTRDERAEAKKATEKDINVEESKSDDECEGENEE